MRSVVTVLWLAAALVSGRAFAQEQGAPGSQQPTTAEQGAAPAKKRWQPGRWWLATGPTAEDIEDAADDCGGGQIAVGFGGRRAFAKLQFAVLTYESRDRADSCNGGEDSWIQESALLVGVSAPSSGLFVALGPARVEVEVNRPPTIEGTGMRFELGWSSRRWRNSKSRFGVEIAVFAVTNGARDYAGSAVSLTIGQGGR
jgi:hypothetical protein